MDGELVPICCSGEYLWQCSWWWRNSPWCIFTNNNGTIDTHTVLVSTMPSLLVLTHLRHTAPVGNVYLQHIFFSLCIHASILTTDLRPDCRCIYTLYLMSDSYLGLDQQYEIHLNVTATSIAAQVNTEVSDSVTDLSLSWGSLTEKRSSSATVFSDH